MQARVLAKQKKRNRRNDVSSPSLRTIYIVSDSRRESRMHAILRHDDTFIANRYRALVSLIRAFTWPSIGSPCITRNLSIISRRISIILDTIYESDRALNYFRDR